MPGLYQYLELSWTKLALTLVSGSSLRLDWAEPRRPGGGGSSATEGEKVTWCCCPEDDEEEQEEETVEMVEMEEEEAEEEEGVEAARSSELCPLSVSGETEENRFFSGSGGWGEGMVTAVYPV